MFIRIALKELKNNLHFSFLFIVNLSLGLCGFVSLDIFKYSLDSSLQEHSKAILGADFGVSARRPIASTEREIISKKLENYNFSESKMTEMYSMVSSADNKSHLVHVRAIEENFPFYGEVILRHQGSVQPSEKSDLHNTKTAWVYPEIMLKLKLKEGSMISIGEAQFRVSDIVEGDTSTRTFNSVAPRIYISQKYLSETGLIRQGSVAWHSLLYKVTNQDSRGLSKISKNIFESLDDPQLQVYTHENASESVGKLMEYLNDFLALAALVALFLSSVGMAFLFHSYLKSKLQEIAILISFGLNIFKALGIYLIQAFFLGVIGFVIALALGMMLLPVLKNTADQLLPITVGLRFNTVGVSVLLTVLVPLLVSLPLLMSVRKVNASLLLHKVSGHSFKSWDLITFISCVPSALLFWVLAVWQSHSFYIGTLFCVIFLGAALVLAALAYVILICLNQIKKFRFYIVKWAFRDIVATGSFP